MAVIVILVVGADVDAAAVEGGGLTRWDGGVDMEGVMVTLYPPRVVRHSR